MAARRPVALINGRVSEIPVGDSISADLVPPSTPGDAGTFDGGNSTTNFTGQPKIDAGASI